MHVGSILNIQKALGTWADGAVFWFFGKDYHDFLDLERRIPQSATLAPVGEEINNIAVAIKGEFKNLDEQVAGPSSSELDILSSDIVERNPYVGSLFLSSCRYIAFVNALKRGGRHVFVTDSSQFARLLWREAKRLGAGVGWESPRQPLPLGEVFREKIGYIKSVARGLRARLGGVRTLLRHVAYVRRLRKKSPVPLAALRDVDVLVVTWARKDTFSATQATNTATSLGRLPQLIRDGAGQKLGFVSVSLSWVDSFADVARNGVHAKDPVLLLEDVLTYRDIFVASLHSLFAVKSLGANLSVQGYDLSAVLRLEKEREWVSWRPTYAALFAKLGAYLRAHGLSPKAIIYLYEHQSWEKCLLFGLRSNLPKVRMIGCQQSAFAAQYQNFYPSMRDMAKGFVPDVLLVSGERFALIMRQALTNKTNVYNVGAIRYEELFKFSKTEPIVPRRQTGGVSVLCATSSDIHDCCELVAKVASAAQAVGVKVIVNFHPFTDDVFRQIVMDCVAMNCNSQDHLTFSRASAAHLMKDVDAVFYSDTNVAFEAMYKKLPIVHVQRVSSLDYNQVPEEYCEVVRYSQEIQPILLKLKNCVLMKKTSEEIKVGLLASFGPMNPHALVAAIRGEGER